MNEGMFLGTTQNFNIIQKIESIKDTQLRELLLLLYQNSNDIINVLNKKDSAIYTQTEFINGQTYPALPALAGEAAGEDRQVYRMLVEVDGLPNGATKTVAHGITSITNKFMATRIYGAASDTSALEYIPLPYVSSTDPVELMFDATDVLITTSTNMTRFNKCWVVLEYLKY